MSSVLLWWWRGEAAQAQRYVLKTHRSKPSVRPASLVRSYELPELLDTASCVERPGSSNAQCKLL